LYKRIKVTGLEHSGKNFFIFQLWYQFGTISITYSMKILKISWLFLMLNTLLSFGCMAQVMDSLETVREYYPSGVLKAKGTKNGLLKHGVWYYYYPTGVLNAEYTFIYDQMHGFAKYYSPEGKLKAVEEWRFDVQHGKVMEFHPNKVLKKVGYFFQGMHAGEWLFYYPNGTLRQIGYYKNGLPNGLWQTFDEKASITSRGFYQKNKRHGEWRFYDRGRLILKGNYEDGVAVGVWMASFSRFKTRYLEAQDLPKDVLESIEN
jgi:antitoxin component YwqK of YwqJK toxin-antitoxin module